MTAESTSAEPVRCSACGSEQPPDQVAEGRCFVCGKKLLPPRSVTDAAAEAGSAAAPAGRRTTRPSSLRNPRAPDGAAAAAEPPPAVRPSKELDQIRTAERRAAMLVGLVPGFGAWWIARSNVNTPGEKAVVSGVSLFLALLLLGAFWAALPKPAEQLDEVRNRVESDIRALTKLVRAYQAEHGALPDDQPWQRAIENADPRFFDPWSRPYLYARERVGFTIATYGRDGEPGGTGEDGDRSKFVPERTEPESAPKDREPEAESPEAGEPAEPGL